MRLEEGVDLVINPLAKEGVFYKGNMPNISATIPINIFANPNVVENVHIDANDSPREISIYTSLFKEFFNVFTWSYKDMLGIDPSIVEHEIQTYPNAKHVRQKLRPVNPWKVAAIKAEGEKLLKEWFIYPIALIEWVSNPIPIVKK